MSAAESHTGTTPTKRLHPDAAPEGRCPACSHPARYHRPQRGDRTALCYYPTSADGPDCHCTTEPPRPESESK